MKKHTLDVTVPKEVKEAIVLACRINRRSVSGWAWEHLQLPFLELCARADLAHKRKPFRRVGLPTVAMVDASKWRVVLGEKTEWDHFSVVVSPEIKADTVGACKTLRRSVSGWAWEHLQLPFLELCARADAVCDAIARTGLEKVGGSGAFTASPYWPRETTGQNSPESRPKA